MRAFALSLLIAFVAPAALAADATDRRHDEHSHAEPDKVRISDIALNLRVDFDERVLRGHADLRLDWQDRRHRQLVLDTRDIEIERVQGKSGDGAWRRLDFELGQADPIFGSKLTIRLRRPYEVVRVRYRTSPDASGLQWLEPAMTAGKVHPFLFSQSQAIHARSWVPLQDTPSVRFTYSARIITPPQLVALMSADNDPNAARTGEYLFRMPQPVPSYLMAIAAGDLVFRPISGRAGVWAEPSVVEAAVAEFAETEKMIEVTEALYGPYRWGRYDLLILPPSFPYGGMENPRLSFITPTVIVGDRSLTGLIAHELAHSWSGNLVTNASWKDIWLNEGFTTYVENRIVEAVYGRERAEMEALNRRSGMLAALERTRPELQRLALPATPGEDPDEALSPVAYAKGAWFLQFLEQRFGRQEFDAFLRKWFDEHAFKSVTTDDFTAFLREHLLKRRPRAVTEGELDAWINQPGIPANAPQVTSRRFDAVDRARTRWIDGRHAARDIATAEWSTQEWVRFLEGLPATLEADQLIELDEAFGLTGTANPEIAQRWYPLTVRSGYFEAQPSMAAFLKRIGRRKLIMPIYEALAATGDGHAFASQVFAEARPGYHPITTSAVEALLARSRPTP